MNNINIKYNKILKGGWIESYLNNFYLERKLIDTRDDFDYEKFKWLTTPLTPFISQESFVAKDLSS